jgi:glycosyltransferase involved in cell wall biosynthesis
MALKILVNALEKKEIPFELIDIVGSYKKEKHVSVIQRKIDYLIILIRLFFSALGNRNLFYVQTSQSINGFKRDRMINIIARLTKSKVISHLHGGNFNNLYNQAPPKYKKLILKELFFYEKIIVLSERLKEMYSFEPGIYNKIVSIPNGIGNIVGVLPKYIKEPISIIYLSNLIESKGYLILLNSLKLLKDRGIKFYAKFCGSFTASNDSVEVSNEISFQEDIVAYDLKDMVAYEGVVVGEKKNKLLEDAHFFVLPTTYKNEGQPISIIEAMRAGCVTIASNYRAIPEMIEHSKSGILLDKVTPEEIADYISAISADPKRFCEISKNAIIKYNSEFTESIHGNKMVNLIIEIAAN